MNWGRKEKVDQKGEGQSSSLRLLSSLKENRPSRNQTKGNACDLHPKPASVKASTFLSEMAYRQRQQQALVLSHTGVLCFFFENVPSMSRSAVRCTANRTSCSHQRLVPCQDRKRSFLGIWTFIWIFFFPDVLLVDEQLPKQLPNLNWKINFSFLKLMTSKPPRRRFWNAIPSDTDAFLLEKLTIQALIERIKNDGWLELSFAREVAHKSRWLIRVGDFWLYKLGVFLFSVYFALLKRRRCWHG